MIVKKVCLVFISSAVAALLMFSCSTTADESEGEPPKVGPYKIEPAADWTSLFIRNNNWFGGDGIFAIPLNGSDNDPNDSILFVFSDTMVGEIRDTVLQPGWEMTNNSVMVLKGNQPVPDKAEFFVPEGADKKHTSVFIPSTLTTKPGDYYWIGDGFVDHASNNLYVFAYQMRNTNDGSMFPFQELGGVMLVMPRNSNIPFSEYRQIELPFPTQLDDSLSTSFGGAVFANTEEAGAPDPDGYLYIYGVRGRAKELIIARVRPGALENFTTWEYKTNEGWTNDLKATTGLMDSVSNEFSVSPIGKGRYALVYQLGGIQTQICLQIGLTPYGPFGQREYIYNTAKDVSGKDLITYNAKAHPALSKPGELLVSYNVNSFSFRQQIEKTPNFYRPRFFRVVFGEGN